jgi:hypothetical protein
MEQNEQQRREREEQLGKEGMSIRSEREFFPRRVGSSGQQDVTTE